MNKKALISFIYEMGQLKRIRHEGFSLIGADNIDSVAEHSLRAAQIGYFLAILEKYKNPLEVVTALVFHDIGECRIGDIHKVANRYITSHEERAVKDQLFPFGIHATEIFSLWNQIENPSTTLGKIAKDADLLELAFTSKELLEKGYEYAADWLNNIKTLVHTKSAKKLLQILSKTHSNIWWQGLKKISK